MKKLSTSILALAVLTAAAFLASAPARAGDIVNGWSESTKIIGVSGFSTTYNLTLSPTALAGCGTTNVGAWKVTLDTTEGSKFKRAALMAAFIAGQSVQLRCESSVVSDFIVTP